MVRFPLHVLLALSIASCGVARRPAGGFEMPGPRDGAGDELVQRGGEDPDTARRDFEAAEYLAENPAQSDVRPIRATCRLTEGMISLPGRERSDGYLALSAGRWKVLCRGRRTEDAGGAVSYYLSGSAFSEAVRLHGGSFVPDFSLGLIFGGSGGSSLSSRAFPFGNPRRIAGTTSYFLKTLHGVAAEIRRGNAYAAVFKGRPVEYGSNGPETGEGMVSGARIEARRGCFEIGFSGSTGTSETGRRVCAIDGRWRSDRINAGLEMGIEGSAEPSLLSGFSYRASRTRAALLLHAVSPDAAGFFGSVNGRSPGKISSIHGATAAVERDVSRRVRARASIDRYERFDGFHETARQTTRLEFERRGRRILLRLAWTCAAEDRRDVAPYPPAEESAFECSNSLGLLSEFRLDRKTSVGATLKRVEETDGLGWLFAPVLRTRLFAARLRVTASIAAYRTAFGHPVCYVYEPSLPGRFPLRVVSRDVDSMALVISYNINRLGIFLHVKGEDWRAPEISLQASAGL